MAALSPEILRVTEVVSRLNTLGGVLDLRLGELVHQCNGLGAELRRYTRVSVTDAFDSVAVMTEFPSDPAARQVIVDTVGRGKIGVRSRFFTSSMAKD